MEERSFNGFPALKSINNHPNEMLWTRFKDTTYRPKILVIALIQNCQYLVFAFKTLLEFTADLKSVVDLLADCGFSSIWGNLWLRHVDTYKLIRQDMRSFLKRVIDLNAVIASSFGPWWLLEWSPRGKRGDWVRVIFYLKLGLKVKAQSILYLYSINIQRIQLRWETSRI